MSENQKGIQSNIQKESKKETNELLTMNRIERLLGDLAESARNRTVRWLFDKYAVKGSIDFTTHYYHIKNTKQIMEKENPQ